MVDYRRIIEKHIKKNISKLLSLLDRNKYSKTYGCFDREYWHYKSKYFFNGMNQCYILSLALLYTINIEGNYLYRNKRVRELIVKAIHFTFSHIHKDGSLDEHYYNEHSIVATSFVLYAITETIIILNINPIRYKHYIKKMVDFLISNMRA